MTKLLEHLTFELTTDESAKRRNLEVIGTRTMGRYFHWYPTSEVRVRTIELVKASRPEDLYLFVEDNNFRTYGGAVEHLPRGVVTFAKPICIDRNHDFVVVLSLVSNGGKPATVTVTLGFDGT